jgi:hypothetical protein
MRNKRLDRIESKLIEAKLIESNHSEFVMLNEKDFTKKEWQKIKNKAKESDTERFTTEELREFLNSED